MGWIVFSVILTIVIFCAIGGFNISRNRSFRSGTQLLCLLGLLFMAPAFIAQVPANCVGIRYNAFTGTSEETVSEGYHVKSPLDTIYNISTEVKTTNVAGLTTQTQDSQYVSSTLDVKYRVSASNAYVVFKQYKTLQNMSDSLIIPTTQRVLELITTKYNVMDILGESRSQIYLELEEQLTKELEEYGVEFYAISITDMDAGDQIEAAITAEAVAKKQVETAAQELLKAETQAKQLSVQAQAEQDAAKIAAETKIIEAQAERDANELLNFSLTDEVLIQQWIDKWNGEVPTYYGGNGADLIFNTGSLSNAPQNNNVTE